MTYGLSSFMYWFNRFVDFHLDTLKIAVGHDLSKEPLSKFSLLLLLSTFTTIFFLFLQSLTFRVARWKEVCSFHRS